MTRRPRSHQLETESRLAFTASLPSAWVFRDLTPDYGLDGVVEVFDERGLATGHLFFVQLKATDQAATALRVRLSRRLLDYYTTLVLPVLLVVFQAPTSTLYARWVSNTLRPPLRESGSVTIRLYAEDHWNPARFPAVIQELTALRAATELGNRELRIQRYYDQRRAINPAEKPVGPPHPIQRFQQGDRVLHGVFGLGTVDQESDSYLFVQFDEDDVARKFFPGDTWEFVRLDRANGITSRYSGPSGSRCSPPGR